MKKWILYGCWGFRGSCEVVGYYKIAESNNLADLHMTIHTEYRDDGTWHYQRIDKRTYARSLGLS